MEIINENGATAGNDAFCPHCGAKIQSNTRFCPECGKNIRQEVASDGGNRKDKLAAGLLAIFLGTLGIHYFYIGKSTAGILTIVISLCSCGLWGIITFIQGIMMLVMSEDEFNAKYVNNDRTFPLF